MVPTALAHAIEKSLVICTSAIENTNGIPYAGTDTILALSFGLAVARVKPRGIDAELGGDVGLRLYGKRKTA